MVGDRDTWEAVWALAVPKDTDAAPGKVPDVEVRVKEWPYGTVAQILHTGPYSAEPATIRRLHAFIAAQGYEIAGAHEEEYLTRPDAKVPRTIIRCPVRRRALAQAHRAAE